MNNELKNVIEALLMVSDVPLGVAKLQGLFDPKAAPTAEEIKEAIGKLEEEYAGRGIEIRKIGSGYRIQTREQYADWIRKLLAGRPPRLSRAQLETLAIIAYQQPVTRGDIEEIRGVSVSPDIMQRLLEREWIKEVGVRDAPGRPALFGTTPEFLSYFNLTSLNDLPPLKEQRDFSEISQDLEVPLPPEVLAALEEGDKPQKDVFDAGSESEQVEALQSDESDPEVAAVESIEEEEIRTGTDSRA